GLGESTVTSAVMYGTYNGTKQVLTSDDISGIDSIYGAHQYDHFNSGGSRNSTFLTATNITSDINAQSQISLSGLDNTTPTDDEWYVVTVPSTTTGQMTVSVQTANLSSLAPGLMVYNSSLSLLAETSSTSEAGVTISTTLSVSSGQKYYFKVLAGGSGTVGTVGAYGLLVNFGSQAQSPIAPPNTVVAQQPDEGGGTISNARVADAGADLGIGATSSTGDRHDRGKNPVDKHQEVRVTIGSLTGLVGVMSSTATGRHGGRAFVLDQLRETRKLARHHEGRSSAHGELV
ncbi:MAG: hypothetical protein ACLQGP_12850, partial [Isosphaeraceae bacterium]